MQIILCSPSFFPPSLFSHSRMASDEKKTTVGIIERVPKVSEAFQSFKMATYWPNEPSS